LPSITHGQRIDRIERSCDVIGHGAVVRPGGGANPGASILFVIAEQILPRTFQGPLNSTKGRHKDIQFAGFNSVHIDDIAWLRYQQFA